MQRSSKDLAATIRHALEDPLCWLPGLHILTTVIDGLIEG